MTEGPESVGDIEATHDVAFAARTHPTIPLGPRTLLSPGGGAGPADPPSAAGEGLADFPGWLGALARAITRDPPPPGTPGPPPDNGDSVPEADGDPGQDESPPAGAKPGGAAAELTDAKGHAESPRNASQLDDGPVVIHGESGEDAGAGGHAEVESPSDGSPMDEDPVVVDGESGEDAEAGRHAPVGLRNDASPTNDRSVAAYGGSGDEADAAGLVQVESSRDGAPVDARSVATDGGLGDEPGALGPVEVGSVRDASLADGQSRVTEGEPQAGGQFEVESPSDTLSEEEEAVVTGEVSAEGDGQAEAQAGWFAKRRQQRASRRSRKAAVMDSAPPRAGSPDAVSQPTAGGEGPDEVSAAGGVNDDAAADDADQDPVTGDLPASAEPRASDDPPAIDDWVAHLVAADPSLSARSRRLETPAPGDDDDFWGLAKKGVAGWGHEPSVNEMVSFWRALVDEPTPAAEADPELSDHARAWMSIALRMPSRGITTIRPGRTRTVPAVRPAEVPKTDTWLDFLPAAPAGAPTRGTSYWQPATPAWGTTPTPTPTARPLTPPPATTPGPVPELAAPAVDAVAEDGTAAGPVAGLSPSAELSRDAGDPPEGEAFAEVDVAAGPLAGPLPSAMPAMPADAPAGESDGPAPNEAPADAVAEVDDAATAASAAAPGRSADRVIGSSAPSAEVLGEAPVDASPVAVGPAGVGHAAGAESDDAADSAAVVAPSVDPVVELETPVAEVVAPADASAVAAVPGEATSVHAAEDPAADCVLGESVAGVESLGVETVEGEPVAGVEPLGVETVGGEPVVEGEAVEELPVGEVTGQPGGGIEPAAAEVAGAPSVGLVGLPSAAVDDVVVQAGAGVVGRRGGGGDDETAEMAIEAIDLDEAVVEPIVGRPVVPAAEIPDAPSPSLGLSVGAVGTRVGVVGGGVAFADALGVLERRRRAQQGYRQWGRQIALPVAPLDGDERELRQGADPEGAAYLEAALRAAAAGAGSEGVPPLRWVEASAERVVLALATPGRPPPPGFSIDGDTWVTKVPFDELSQLAMPALAPVPALVPLGATRDRRELLVDLESRRVVTVDGGFAEVAGLMRAVVVAASTASWCPQVRILAVGLQPELAGLPGVEVVDTLDVALTLAESHARAVMMALSAIGGIPVSAARAKGLSSQAAEAMLVVSARAPEDRHVWRRLEALRREGTVGVGLLVRHPPAEAGNRRSAPAQIPTIQVDADEAGTVHLSNRGGNGVRHSASGRALDAVGARRLVALLETAMRRDGGDVSVRPQGRPTGEAVSVVVRVLGDVEVVHWDGRPVDGTASRAVEVLAYLGLQESAVTTGTLEDEVFADSSLPAGAVDAAVAVANHLLGAGDLILRPTPARVVASDRVVTDYGLFCGLVGWAVAIADPVEATALLTEALQYVRSVPLAGQGRHYAWSGPQREAIVSHVVDAAESLAQLAAARNDWPLVEWAVGQGLRAAPGAERLHCWRMRAAHAVGDIGLVHERFEELCDIVADPLVGVEPEATLQPSTVALLEHLVSRPLPEPQSVAGGQLHVLADRPSATTQEIPAVEVARALHGGDPGAMIA